MAEFLKRKKRQKQEENYKQFHLHKLKIHAHFESFVRANTCKRIHIKYTGILAYDVWCKDGD